MDELVITLVLFIGILFKAKLSKIKIFKFVSEQLFSIILFFPFVTLVIFFERVPYSGNWPWFILQSLLATILILVFIKDKEKEW